MSGREEVVMMMMEMWWRPFLLLLLLLSTRIWVFSHILWTSYHSQIICFFLQSFRKNEQQALIFGNWTFMWQVSLWETKKQDNILFAQILAIRAWEKNICRTARLSPVCPGYGRSRVSPLLCCYGLLYRAASAVRRKQVIIIIKRIKKKKKKLMAKKDVSGQWRA